MFRDYDDRLIAEEDWADYESRLEPWELDLIYAPPSEDDYDNYEKAFDWIRQQDAELEVIF